MKLNIFVPALHRGLSILELLSQRELGFNEIREELNIPGPSLAALLKQLLEQEYIEKNESDNKYKLGRKLLILGNAYLSKIDLREKARPHMEKLREECEETIELGILDRGEVLFIDKLESFQSIRLFTQIGRKFTRLHASAPGKIALAWMDDEERKRFFARFSSLPSVTKKTIINKKRLLEQLKEIRCSGCAWDDEEARVGVRRFAAPILSHDKKLAGILTIAGPAYRLKLSQKKKFTSLLKRAAFAVSQDLGYEE